MAWYKIYAGLDGGFGGATYRGTYEFETEDDAWKEAYDLAWEEYESYAGLYGLLDWDGAYEDWIESFNEIPTDEQLHDHYTEIAEGWMDYYVREAESEHDVEDE